MATTKFIGREREQAILQTTRQSGAADMVAVIGRRRVGKTSLIKTNKQVFLTLISTFGIKPNTNSVGLVNRSFDMNVLFEPID